MSTSSSDEEIIKLIKNKDTPESVSDVEDSSADEVDSPTNEEAQSLSEPEPEDEDEGNKKGKEIDSIIDHRPKDGKVQYLIKYKGFPKVGNEWINEENLAEHADLIIKYMGGSTSIPPKKVKIDIRNTDYEILNGFLKKGRIFYKLLYGNGEDCTISSKKLLALNPLKLIEFLEDHCIENEIVKSVDSD